MKIKGSVSLRAPVLHEPVIVLPSPVIDGANVLAPGVQEDNVHGQTDESERPETEVGNT